MISEALPITHRISDRRWDFEEALGKQIRGIDKPNARGLGFRILKSAEVGTLADGALDYPDDLLAKLDYTLCSIHSRFALGKKEPMEQIMRAMNKPFVIFSAIPRAGCY